MTIVKLKNAKFGTDKIYRKVSGYALHEEGKGFIAFSHERDKYNILTPYVPCGGKNALESIIKDGGFISFNDIEFVTPLT